MVARSSAFEIPSIRDGSDSAVSSAGLGAGLLERMPAATVPTLDIPDGIYPEALVAAASPTAFASENWSTIKPSLDMASAINYSTAAENQAAGVEPDFILGTDGQIRANPNKTQPSPDGSINIQLEGENNQDKVQALRSANEAQKASVRELIRYFQKHNPNAKIPTEWLEQLEKQPDFPTPGSGPRRDAPAQASPARDYSPGPGSSPSGGSRRGGGYSGGGRSGGVSPRGGTRPGGTPSAENFTPSDRPQRQPMFRAGRPDTHPPIAGDLAMRGGPTIDAQKIDQVLRSYGSPAAGLGQEIYDEGVRRGIDPAVALAFFVKESSAGTKGVATQTNSWGNIKGRGPEGSVKGFRAYSDFKEGMHDWYRLMDEVYLRPKEEGGRGYTHLSQVIRTYAPQSDGNNEALYVANVKGMVQGWARDSQRSGVTA